MSYFLIVFSMFPHIIQEVRVRYHGKNLHIGTFPTLEQATLANKVARGILQATKDSILTDEQIDQNVKLAKEAASKSASEMYSSKGSSDDDELNLEEPGTLAPGRWQSNEVRRLFCASIAFALYFILIYTLCYDQTKVFIEWLTDRKSKWKQDRQNKHPKEDDRGPSLVAGRWQTDKVSCTKQYDTHLY